MNDHYHKVVKPAYLAEHPLCQVFMAEHRIDERAAVAAYTALGASHFDSGGRAFDFGGHMIPLATDIHHRNKRHGVRLIDVRYFMAASRAWHDEIENHKDWARANAYLLPVNADKDGRGPDGIQFMPTPEMMEFRAGLSAAGMAHTPRRLSP